MTRKWQIAKKITEEYKNQFAEQNPIILQLLNNRDLMNQDAVDEFLNPDYGQDLHDPFIFRDMKKAVERIFTAIEKKEKIIVHGDYDADGVSATAIVVSVLQALGADVNVYIPHRMLEGYGLNRNTVDEFSKKGVSLIITVDCGIASKDEIELANTKDINVIVTDHHEEPPELPKAFAIINPHVNGEKYPCTALSGAGVAYKLVQALCQHDGGKKLKQGYEKWLLDLVAIGTIADLVPLIGENRTLVRYGIIVLRKTRRVGLQKLIENSRMTASSLNTMNVSFGIVPRLNAAGRIDHANTAYQLLITENPQEAEKLTQDLDKTNQDRQKITERILKLSREQIGTVKEQKLLSACGKGWELGVVGLVAGRLADEFSRPVLIMGEKEDGNEIVGSGRSVPGFDITKALVESRELLDRFGGHAAACGFTVFKENYDGFINKMTEIAEREISDETTVKQIAIDVEITFSEASWELVKALEQFEPFGVGNKYPRFVTQRLTIEDVQRVGKEGKHLRLNIQHNGKKKKVIAFGFGNEWGSKLSIGEMVDIVYELSFNEWNGNRELQLKLVDIKICN